MKSEEFRIKKFEETLRNLAPSLPPESIDQKNTIWQKILAHESRSPALKTSYRSLLAIAASLLLALGIGLASFIKGSGEANDEATLNYMIETFSQDDFGMDEFDNFDLADLD